MCPDSEGGLRRPPCGCRQYSDNGGAVHASKGYIILHGVQTAQLQHDEKQEKQPRTPGDEQVLQILQEAYAPQGNKITTGGKRHG